MSDLPPRSAAPDQRAELAEPAELADADLAELADADLLARHVAGDPNAFGELVRRHRDRLWAVALRVTGDREEAADALQDGLLSALRASGGGAFRGDAAVTTWLHRIVVNACLDRMRRARARPVVPLPDEVPPAPGDPFAAQDTAIVVQAALAALPPEQRAALVLVDMQGWSVQEAARILDVPAGTVKSRCARGRARLLPLLTGVRPQPGEGNRSGGAGVPSAPGLAPDSQRDRPTGPAQPAQPAQASPEGTVRS